MNFRNLSYAIMEAFRSLIKNRLNAAASVITLASCLFMVAVSFCLAVNLDYILLQIESMMSITVYLEESMPAEAIDNLIKRVSGIPHITQIEFISSEEALERFKISLEDSSHILDGYETAEVLPPSLVLDIDNIGNWDQVENSLNALREDGIETIRHGRSAANALMTINNVLRAISLLVIIGLGIISIVIIINTIRIAVNTRKTEINIMKYVGATDAFIRGPFIVEGMVIGILGAALPFAVVYFLYNPLIVYLLETIDVMDFMLRPQAFIFTMLTPILFIAGVFIGILGSTISFRRYLNV